MENQASVLKPATVSTTSHHSCDVLVRRHAVVFCVYSNGFVDLGALLLNGPCISPHTTLKVAGEDSAPK